MKITDFGYNGEGVGHIDGKVCFVPYTLVGEEVEVEVQKQTSSFIKGLPKNIIESSCERQIAPCPYFAKCGGCDFQHMSYQDELKLKEGILKRQLKKVGYEKSFKIVASKRQYGYRNKIKVFSNGNGLGLNRANSNKVVEINNCLLIDDEMNKVLVDVQNFVKAMKLGSMLENVVLRKNNQKIYVWFIYKILKKIDYMGLALALGKNVNIFYSEGLSTPQPAFKNQNTASVEFGLSYDFKVDAFHQVNDEICTQLYEKVAERVNGKIVVNAYSGAGLLSGMLCHNAKMVYGVEFGQSEHESAELLKSCNHLNNLQNILGKCEEILPNFLEKYDSIVVDPPRSGCDEKVCEAIDNSGAKQLVYVSCSPASLVRDIGRLKNYTIKDIVLFDMFPRTANFEVFVEFAHN